MKNPNSIFRILLLAVGCLGVLPGTHAVVPAPDGGYADFNTAEGQNALFSLTTGAANTAVGWHSLFSNAEGSFNTATGAGALLFNTGNKNTAFGAAALLFNSVGIRNTALGAAALLNNTVGDSNMAIGGDALFSNTTGSFNTAIGNAALVSNTTGALNTAVGSNVFSGLTTGSFNTGLGVSAGSNVTAAENVIVVGTAGANVNNSCFIGNIRGVTTQNPNPIPVLIDSNGQLGTVNSSRRFKKEIKPMDKASEAIFGLTPVMFHYKSDKTATPQFGLIAEEVAEVNPDLVVRDENGEIYTVRYDVVNTMLLNEFLKEHRTVQELKKEVAALKTTVGEQNSKIQKVSDQLELNKPSPQLVDSNN